MATIRSAVLLGGALLALAFSGARPAAAASAGAPVDSLRPTPQPLDPASAAALGLGRALGRWGRVAPEAALLPLAESRRALLAGEDAARANLLEALAALATGDGAALAVLAEGPANAASPALRTLALLVERGEDWRPGDPPLLAALAIEAALARATRLDAVNAPAALPRARALHAAADESLPPALALQLAARLAEAAGEDAQTHWRALAARVPASDWEAALIAEAAHRAEPAPPAAGDRGRLLAARRLLDERRGEEAWPLLLAVEATRAEERARLAALDPAAAADSLLALAGPGGLALAAEPVAALLAAIDAAAADRRRALDTIAGGAALALAAGPAPSLRLAPAAWDSLRRAAAGLGAARRQAAQRGAALDARRADRAARDRYLDGEAARLAALRAELAAATGPIDSLGAAARSEAAGLARVLADHREALLARAARLTARAQLQAEAQRALAHLRLEGPRARRPRPALDADSVLAADGALAAELLRYGRDYGDGLPGTLARAERAAQTRLASWPAQAKAALSAQAAAASALAARLAGLRGAVDPETVALAGALAAAEQRKAVATAQLAATKRAAAVALIAARLAALDREQELLDYQLAEAALLRAEAAPADDPAGRGLQAEAAARCERFLAAHPQSAARGELRFQLAELRLVDAQRAFAAQLARFLGERGAVDESAQRALAPFLAIEPACALYRAILAEDADFSGRAAVRFNLGMLLDEQGDPEGQRQLALLLSEFPEAPERPRAELRLAERALQRGARAEAAPHYAAVAASGDPELARVALYTLGWLRYGEDRFLEAAALYRQLIDLETAEAARGAGASSLAAEAGGHLAECLVRAGGARAWSDFFAGAQDRPYAFATLERVASLERDYGFHAEAAAADSLWLARQPLAPGALAQAERLLADRRAAGAAARVDQELDALALRFLPGAAWQQARAAGEDSLARAGRDFARRCLLERGGPALERARAGGEAGDWRIARASLETLLAHWPRDPESAQRRLAAGETAARLGDSEAALVHFADAAVDPALAALADWQALALLDALHSAAAAAVAAAPASGARARFLAAGDRYLDRHPEDPRAPALLWRLSALREATALHAEAAAGFARFAGRWPAHAAAPLAAARSGDALSRTGDAARAAARYEAALALARAAGADSLSAALGRRIPECHFIAAAAGVAADSSACAGARRFADLAAAWPRDPRADEAWYRAGLGFAACGEREAAAAAFAALAAQHPASALRGDAQLQTAALLRERAPRRAAAALAAFAESARDPDDLAQAPDALREAIALAAAAGDQADAERYRERFLARFPAHPAALTEILHARALAVLAAKGDAPLADARAQGGPLAAYLEGVAAQPALGDPELLAQVDYLACLAAERAFAAQALTDPLETSLARKQALLAALAEQSQRVLAHGSRRWSRAAAYLLGASLYRFGDELLAVPAPAALGRDDRLAFLEVLEGRAWELHARGERSWRELVRQADPADGDPDNWVAITKNALWPRIARRCLHLPALEFPLVAAAEPSARP
ncbi:hypothetical protein FJ251_03955 [bacterium]|nr:hypothetical protein [bacterium]